MYNVLFFILLLLGFSPNAIAQQIRVGAVGNENIVLKNFGTLEFQNERKYRGYLVKLTNAGSKLAVGYKGGVQVWDTSTSKYKLCLGEEGRTYNNVAFSKNGEYLAGYREKKIFVWESSTCRILRSLSVDRDLNHYGLAISSNGKYLFYSHDASKFLREREKVILWDLDRGVEIGDLQPERLRIWAGGYDPLYDREALTPSNADFSPDSKILAVQYSYRIYLWDTATGKSIHRFVDRSLDYEMSHAGIYSVSFSHDGSHLISRGADGTVKLWDLKEKELKQTFRLHERVHGQTSISKDNKYIATGGISGEISVWEVSSGRMLWKGARKNYFPSFSDPDVGLLSVENGQIYDVKSGRKIEGLNGEFLMDGKLLRKEKDGNMSTWIVERTR